MKSLSHLRFGFSLFLLPVFLLGLCICQGIYTQNAVILFVALHLMIYPASNGYNSYYDRDNGEIGGLAQPSPVTNLLLYVSVIFSIAGVVMGAYINSLIGILLFVYVVVSTLYSHFAVRFKSDPFLSVLSVAIFQGGLIVFTTFIGCSKSIPSTFPFWLVWFLAFSIFALASSYPITQSYQSVEDLERGDTSLASRFGPKRMMHICSAFLAISLLFLLLYSTSSSNLWLALVLLTAFMVAGILSKKKYLFLLSEGEVTGAMVKKLNVASSFTLIAFCAIYIVITN